MLPLNQWDVAILLAVEIRELVGTGHRPILADPTQFVGVIPQPALILHQQKDLETLVGETTLQLAKNLQ